MRLIDQQSLNDLEFDGIKFLIHDYCHSDSARIMAVDLAPLTRFSTLQTNLKRTHEFFRIKTESYSFPRIEFSELEEEIEFMKIHGVMLGIPSILNILRATRLSNEILRFFKENQAEFPLLPILLDDIYYTLDIEKLIAQVMDGKGEIHDDASPELAEIRGGIVATKRQINRNFNRILKELKQKGWLAETQETFVNDRRVLSVLSSHKRQVGGRALGASKTGNWSYIEPDINAALNFELEQLIDDEQREIRRILTELSGKLSQHRGLIAGYQKVLVAFDFINAKTRLAIDLDANLPGFAEEQQIEMVAAYHPLLLLTNKKTGQKIMPQNINMDKFSRMLVISGPNAGGKSITLKTVGILQVMFQSGLMVPVAPESKMCFFHAILTDIGDNQSIENQLSTYSYRLKRMKHFLKVSNRRTLLLLDEFGTGSDPDLGGALAEVFFEELYRKKAFAVITTHYANIKSKAAQLKNAVNACMLFDQESLEPLFKLSVGQPGSSFTFEVAEINGIERRIIDTAKSKLDHKKVNFDSMIVELQKEKGRVEKLNKAFIVGEEKARKAEEAFEKTKEKYEERLKNQQQLIEANNQLLTKGKKIESYIKRFNTGGGNRPLLDEVRKYLAVEKTKSQETNKKTKLKEKSKLKRKKKNQQKANADKIKIGSMVKLSSGREKGTVLELNRGKALVAFGVFKTQVEISKLVFLE